MAEESLKLSSQNPSVSSFTNLSGSDLHLFSTVKDPGHLEVGGSKEKTNNGGEVSKSTSNFLEKLPSLANARFSLRDELNSASRSNMPNANLSSTGSISNYINLILGGKDVNTSLASFNEHLPATLAEESSNNKSSGNISVGPQNGNPMPTHAPSNQLVSQTISTEVTPVQSHGDNQQSKQLIVAEDPKQIYVDITEYLNLPQTEAAKKLCIPTSTLSKRWKEAVVNRKWPYRTVCKLEKEIMTLLHNIPQGPDAPPLSPEIEHSLAILLRKRQEELRPVIIRVPDDMKQRP